MVKKTNKRKCIDKQAKYKKKYPFVSVCTPTFNRRPFIKAMVDCFTNQTYPMDRMEWIIIDDGTDKIGDMLEQYDISGIKYFSIDEKMTLGRKRNMMHEKSVGEIIVYMDDDDYYPPERVSHAVDTLNRHPSALCAGSSELYVWFEHINRMVQFGPYGPNHATAGTFAFRRRMLDTSVYDNDASLAEEKFFLRNYTVPFVQLDPKKTILVVAHDHNTFDKKTLLVNMKNNPVQKYVDITVDSIIKDPIAAEFYKSVNMLLVDYAAGRPDMKPDVLSQMTQMKENRGKQKSDMAASKPTTNDNTTISLQNGNVPLGIEMSLKNGELVNLTANQVIDVIKKQSIEINRLNEKIKHLEESKIDGQ